MTISIALARLAVTPPGWLTAGVVGDAAATVESATTPRRRRELLWSRGLRANLLRRVAGDTVQTSIAHDRHFAAVAVSQCDAIGIDLQSDRPLESCRQIAETWFPAAEAKEIIRSPQCERFLISWVIKEAWAKYRNQSIFESCRRVAVWRGRVHVTDGSDPPRFAWSRHHFRTARRANDELCASASGVAATSGFTVGLCLPANASNRSQVECLMPTADAELQPIESDWQWLPVAQRASK